MSKNIKIGFIILFILIVGLILSVVLSRQTTQTKQNASGFINLNTSGQISQTKNKDLSMGPQTSAGNYSNRLTSDNLGSITFSITDPVVGNPVRIAVSEHPTFPPRIPTVTPSSSNGTQSSIPTANLVNGPQKVKSLIIQINKIEVHLKDTKLNGNTDAWETLNIQSPMSIDLTQVVNGAIVNFSLTKIAAGDYDEARLYVSKATATLENGEVVTLDSSGKNGIVRVLENFTVDKGRNTNLVMDFDSQQSVEYLQNKLILDLFVSRLDVNK